MKSLTQVKQEQKEIHNKPWYNTWFTDWYESALIEIVNHFTSINIVNESLNQPSKIFKSTQLEDMFRNLLK